MDVLCEAFYSSDVGKVDRQDLIDWLQSLPDQHELIPQPMTHGKLWIKAEWTEMR